MMSKKLLFSKSVKAGSLLPPPQWAEAVVQVLVILQLMVAECTS